MRCETGKAEQIVDDAVATLVSFASLHEPTEFTESLISFPPD